MKFDLQVSSLTPHASCLIPHASFNALILETISDMPIPKIPITAKEYLNPAACEMYPIRGGPIRKPRKLTLETVARAMPGGTLVCLPAAL